MNKILISQIDWNFDGCVWNHDEWIFKPWYTPLVESTSAGTAKKRQP